jgi:peptide/nickel transport system permease protein
VIVADPGRIAAVAHRALRGTGARIALGVLVLFVLAAVGAKWVAPYDPDAQPQVVTQTNLSPSPAHPFGTDRYSRDVLSRVIWGARLSLGVAAASVLLALTVGTAFGAVAGYAGGWVDAVLMRIVDAVLSVPRVLMLIVIVASTGSLSPAGIVLALGLTGWAGMGRVVRVEVRALRERDYVLAARATGVPKWRTLTAHILPGVVPYLLVAGTLSFATVIPLEAGLSYLGLGIQPPHSSWGSIIFDGVDLVDTAWWTVFFPGLAIVATVLAVNTLGERLREAVDPRQLPAQ